MRLVTYAHPATGNTPRSGVLQGDRVLDVNALTEGRASDELLRVLDRWETAQPAIARAAERFAEQYLAEPELPTSVAVPVWEVALHAPLPSPRSFRDFFAFEDHARIGFERRGRSLPAAWYERPTFFFGNHGSFVGPDQNVPKPVATSELDFEAELAVVIGIGGRDIAVADAMSHVAGFTLLNDWSARDIQREEMTVGLGPAKGKDFATSLGPWLVTPDELADVLRDGRLAVDVVVRVHGEELGRGNGADMHWSFADLIAEASRDADLRPGDVIGSGTVPGGCLYELGTDQQAWLEPGDEVEIEAAGLGRLRNRIV